MYVLDVLDCVQNICRYLDNCENLLKTKIFLNEICLGFRYLELKTKPLIRSFLRTTLFVCLLGKFLFIGNDWTGGSIY